ncbi:T6SS immunity protein Tli3 family protein [Cupriavidus campinensis]
MRYPLLLLPAAALLAGCAHDPYPYRNGGPPVIDYDVPPQVIYRIDDHRFVTLENYRDCHHGVTYYNDAKQGIRQRLGRAGIENFQGRLINADPTGQNIVIPSSAPPDIGCSDRGCTTSLLYSTDGGKTFFGVRYMTSFNPFRDTAKFTIAVTKAHLYVAERMETDSYVREYPLAPEVDLRKPYPPGFRGSTFAASKRPGYLDGLRSPSGQERFTCDPSIRPANLPAPK